MRGWLNDIVTSPKLLIRDIVAVNEADTFKVELAVILEAFIADLESTT